MSDAVSTVGFDTGFFFRLFQGDARAAQVWGLVTTGEMDAVVSCVWLYELERAALKGALGRDEVDALLDGLPDLCRVVWLDEAGQLSRAARLAHSTGLAMADSLILTSLLDAGAATVYTTDGDFERYDGDAAVVFLRPRSPRRL